MNARKTAKENRIHREAVVLIALSVLLVAGCGGGGDGGSASSSAASNPSASAIANPSPSAGAGISAVSGGASAGASGSASAGVANQVTNPPGFTGYAVTGNTITDKSSGQAHLFRGVASPSMSWQPQCDRCTLDQFQRMSQVWKANVVRLSVNQGYWLRGSATYSAGYAAELARVVATIEQAGMDVILDNHGSGSRYMADANTVVFWREVAAVYQHDPHVLFELFNEPNQITWDVWLNGGMAPDGPVHGMQELYNAVRSTGATNLVVIGGLSWAYDLSGVPTHRVVGNNIVYNTHPYSYPGKQPQDWDYGFGFLAQTDPIIATEFGNTDCSTGYYQAFVNYAKAHHISWTAWAWFPDAGCGFPPIISDWDGTPTATGLVVKGALLNP
jgi:hypothetical protein